MKHLYNNRYKQKGEQYEKHKLNNLDKARGTQANEE